MKHRCYLKDKGEYYEFMRTGKASVTKEYGEPDRAPIQFDLCHELTDHFRKELGITNEYALSYYVDLTYSISANEIRTKMGSDVVVVGGTVACQ